MVFHLEVAEATRIAQGHELLAQPATEALQRIALVVGLRQQPHVELGVELVQFLRIHCFLQRVSTVELEFLDRRTQCLLSLWPGNEQPHQAIHHDCQRVAIQRFARKVGDSLVVCLLNVWIEVLRIQDVLQQRLQVVVEVQQHVEVVRGGAHVLLEGEEDRGDEFLQWELVLVESTMMLLHCTTV